MVSETEAPGLATTTLPAAPPATGTLESTETPTSSARPRVWPVIPATLLLYLMGQIVAIGIVIIVFALVPRAPGHTFSMAIKQPSFVALGIAVTDATVVLITILAARSAAASWRERLGLVSSRVAARELPMLVLACVGALGIGYIATLSLQALKLVPAVGESRDFGDWATAAPLTKVALVVSGSFLTGFTEELLCRGYLQRGLLRGWPPAFAIGTSSLLFAFMHGDTAYDVYVLPVAIFLGFLAWRAGSILPGIVCHASVNCIGQSATVFGWVHSSGPSVPDAPDTRAIVLVTVVFIVCVAAVAMGVWRLERGVRATTIMAS